ncbi:MAG TPA: acetyl-CoA carboxylase biotin carboxyl carrier protein [Phycisphaerales bacterium]|nr:acetyl-CoA carboxylase biotin carboxyl carrier protein [Phycisphaerales bacterium]
MIDIRKLKELVRLMVENELSELNLQDQQETVQVKRGGAGVPMVAVGGNQVHVPASRSASVDDDGEGGGSAAPASGAGPGGGGGGESEAGLVAIVSPMVGTFYAAPRPDAPPFTTVGAAVAPDTTVCMVEAMKVFNEIKAETSGTIAKVLVQSGSAVEYGQKLFLVRPS